MSKSIADNKDSTTYLKSRLLRPQKGPGLKTPFLCWDTINVDITDLNKTFCTTHPKYRDFMAFLDPKIALKFYFIFKRPDNRKKSGEIHI